MKLKWILYGGVALYALYSIFIKKSEPTDYQSEMVTEEVILPTEGLITTVKEVEKDQFKIEDEVNVPTIEESRIIAKYMDATIDTFTLEEAALVASDEEGEHRHRNSSLVRAASYGFMGYMFGRNMGGGGFSPNSNAYVDQNTYNRVSNGAGNNLKSTATRTTVSRPKSGFGGSSSTRSYGG